MDKFDINNVLNRKTLYPLWLTVSQSAKISGVNTKTIRRAIQAKSIVYKIVNNRYLIDFTSLIKYMYSNKKLENKLNTKGIGQYVEKWHD